MQYMSVNHVLYPKSISSPGPFSQPFMFTYLGILKLSEFFEIINKKEGLEMFGFNLGLPTS